MASGACFAVLTGKCTRDPEVRNTAGGTPVMSVGVGWNTRFKNKNGSWDESPHFIEVKFYGSRGEAFAEYHKKGSNCIFQGCIEMEAWTDKKTGEKRKKHVFRGDQWLFVPRESQPKQEGAPTEMRTAAQVAADPMAPF